MWVVDTPIGTGSRMVGPFQSYADAADFAAEIELGDPRRLISPQLAKALIVSLESSSNGNEEATRG